MTVRVENMLLLYCARGQLKDGVTATACVPKQTEFKGPSSSAGFLAQSMKHLSKKVHVWKIKDGRCTADTTTSAFTSSGDERQKGQLPQP